MTNLNLVSKLIEKAIASGASHADAVCFSGSDISVSIRNGKTESIERSESCGAGLRVLVGKKQAIVSTTDFSENTINELAARAVDMAKISPEDEFIALAEKDILIKNIPELDIFDKNEPSEEELLNLALKTESSALSVKGISNSEGADASYGKNKIALATSNGFAHEYQTSSSSFSVSVIAGSGIAMERDYDFSTARHSADLKNPDEIGKSAANRTLKRLNPKRPKTQVAPVVFDKRVGRSLLSSFSSAINGASIVRGTSFLKNKKNEKIFADNIKIINDPYIKRGLGSRPFDAEGVEGKKLILVEDGILKEWLLDIRSANKLGLKTNGNATRGMASAPSPSTNNLYMENGEHDLKEIISDIKSGFYVTETFGMGVNILTGDYSQGASGFWIENGEILYPVNEITIAGNMEQMFKNLIPANDLTFEYSTNVPTFRIDGITIAGE